MTEHVRPEPPAFYIERMTRADLDVAIDWAAAEGWNPGLDDAAPFYAADPGGFFVGKLGEEPVGFVSVVDYGGGFGFGGLYIVAAEYRGKGYGAQLARHALDRLAGCNIGQDGVLEQEANYRQMGFKTAYRNVRFEGVVGGDAPEGVTPLNNVPFAEVFDYDTRFFPVPRRRFLEAWLAMPSACGFAIRDQGALAGYGVVRACRTGFKIGPLFAEGPREAELLYQALAAHAGSAPLYLDVPEMNPQAIALASRHGMKRVFETNRMYLKEPPALPLAKIFGVTTFELG